MKMTIKAKREVEVKTLHVSAGVRYWEDSYVNDLEDTEGDRIPCRVGDRWCPVIDIEKGVIINWVIGVKADIHYKICDDGVYKLMDDSGKEIFKKEGYVPSCLSPEEDGFGDYIIMAVAENGSIRGWKPNSVKDIVKYKDED